MTVRADLGGGGRGVLDRKSDCAVRKTLYEIKPTSRLYLNQIFLFVYTYSVIIFDGERGRWRKTESGGVGVLGGRSGWGRRGGGEEGGGCQGGVSPKFFVHNW